MNVVEALTRSCLEANGLEAFHVAWTWPPPARPEVETLAWLSRARTRIDSVFVYLNGARLTERERNIVDAALVAIDGFESREIVFAGVACRPR